MPKSLNLLAVVVRDEGAVRATVARRPELNREVTEDTSSILPESSGRMKCYLEELLEKKSSKRVKALISIITDLTLYVNLEPEFLQKSFATFFYRCLNLVKKDADKELNLASQAIGLLTMLVDGQDNINEIYRELLPILSESLKSGPNTVAVLECLAITTFFGSTRTEETEETMRIIWDFLLRSNWSTGVLVAAVSAWTFLASSLDGWRLSSKYWQGAVSYLLNLIENEDLLVSVAASEGLALIFESRIIDKCCSGEEQNSAPKTYSDSEEYTKGLILGRLHLKQIKKSTAGYKIEEQYSRILDYFQDGCFMEIHESIDEDTLPLSSWPQIIQFNYLKSFLGDEGFDAHIKGNEKLRGKFEFRPSEIHESDQDLCESTVEEVNLSTFLLKGRPFAHVSKEKGKKRKNPIKHAIDRAKTKIMVKNRNLREEMMQWND